MKYDDRQLLNVLKGELKILDNGGYRPCWERRWMPEFTFEDSPVCINWAMYEDDRKPCSECPLMNFVPFDSRNELKPCRHIPLNAAGDTLDSLNHRDQSGIENMVRSWLKTQIARLEVRTSAVCV